jgi:transcriptional regulator with XRE-family HTH domain
MLLARTSRLNHIEAVRMYRLPMKQIRAYSPLGVSHKEIGMPDHKPLATQARIGQAIRKRRHQLDLSLGQLAEAIGVALSTMSKLENGLVPITFERLDRISSVLQVEMAALLSDQPNPAPVPSSSAGGTTTLDHFGTRRSITRSENAVPVEGGVYTLFFHATDLLDKRVQPAVAEILITDIKDYGPYTRHPGEEFNYVISGEVEFHTDVYAPLRLKKGDSIYFDAEMGHAHVKVGDETCVIITVLIPRNAEMAKNNTAPVLEAARIHKTTTSNDLKPRARKARSSAS